MSTWKPIDEVEILQKTENARWLLEGIPKDFWKLIRLDHPEKWSQHPWGDEGNGFWVVGVMGNRCIYYNDIEDGFNISMFKSWGTIEEYYCNQLGLHELITSIVESRFKIS
ncbi:hypothetical protein ACJJIF_03810 [Microbulbifer sp. SSSA002]|uniref:hypothetical protein n=1 Tax=unclassified Microbulbifer TaxID=2619833 RepID=UPI00403A5942